MDFLVDKFGVDELLDDEDPVLGTKEVVEDEDKGLTAGADSATVAVAGSSKDVESANA